MAKSSASIPTWVWNEFRPMTSGMNTPTAVARPRRGHHPTRSSARWASPRQPGRYSRRSTERATHSSTPTPGESLGSTAIVSARSDLLELHAAEQSGRPQDHEHDQDPEHDQV